MFFTFSLSYPLFRASSFQFTQNSELREVLLSTEPKELVEASPYDCLWGVGLSVKDPRITDKSQWRGQNRLGKILVTVHDILKNSQLNEQCL